MAYKSSYTGPQIDQAVGNALIKDTSILSNDVNHIPASSVVKSALTHDLANIVATGATNTTGAIISNGTYFYLDGAMVQAKENIGIGAPFTNGTNYKPVAAGGLNELNAALGKLLWTNPSPRSSMAATSDIAIAASNYTVFIVMAGSYLDVGPAGNIVIKGNSTMLYNFSGATSNIRARLITINDTTFSVGNGIANYSNYSGAEAPTDCIPLFIYGLL